MAKSKIEVNITGLGETTAREILRSIADRKETLEKVATQCLREGQQAAAQKVKGSIDDLYEVYEDIERQLGDVKDEEEEVEGDEGDEDGE